MTGYKSHLLPGIVATALSVLSLPGPSSAQLTIASPDSSTVPPPIVRLVNRAEFLAGRGQLKLAIGKYEEALAAGAGSAQVLNRLAELYLAAGQFAEATRVLKRSLDEEPGQLPVYSRLREAFLAQGKPDSAIFFISEARELAPETSAVRSSLGFLYLQTGLRKLAKAELDTALTLDERNPEAHRFLGYYYTQVDSLKRAIDHYRQVIAFSSEDIEAHNNIAFLHSAVGEYQQALDFYKRTKDLTSEPNLLHAINLNMEAVSAILNGKMRARYILVDTESKGRAVLEKLRTGEDFGTLASQFSQAPNAAVGGDLGFFGPGDMLPEVEEAVLQLEVGAISELLRIAGRVMIIQRLN